MIRSEYRRSWLKALSWRAIATTTMSLVYALTGQIELMVGVGLLDLILKLIFYFLHERDCARTHTNFMRARSKG